MEDSGDLAVGAVGFCGRSLSREAGGEFCGEHGANLPASLPKSLGWSKSHSIQWSEYDFFLHPSIHLPKCLKDMSHGLIQYI